MINWLHDNWLGLLLLAAVAIWAEWIGGVAYRAIVRRWPQLGKERVK